jgi:hypothetical protein
VTGRRGGRRTELEDCHKETRGYWKLKEEQSIAMCGELALGEAVDWLWERLWTCRKTDCGVNGYAVAYRRLCNDQSVLSKCMWCVHRTRQLHTNKQCAFCRPVPVQFNCICFLTL